MVTLREGMVQLNVPIPEELRYKLDDIIIKRCGYTKRGILGELVTEAVREYIEKRIPDHTPTHRIDIKTPKKENVETKEMIPANYSVSSKEKMISSKYNNLIETIKRYSNSEGQITSGLAKKAIHQTIGKDQRTENKYLKILQEDDIFYANSKLGVYEIQSWVLGDYNLPTPPLVELNKTPELEYKK